MGKHWGMYFWVGTTLFNFQGYYVTSFKITHPKRKRKLVQKSDPATQLSRDFKWSSLAVSLCKLTCAISNGKDYQNSSWKILLTLNSERCLRNMLHLSYFPIPFPFPVMCNGTKSQTEFCSIYKQPNNLFSNLNFLSFQVS